MRFLVIATIAALSSCASAPGPERDPTEERWYGETVAELAASNREAQTYFEKRKFDEAAALIVKGGPLASRLLAVRRPTLAATESASDLDQLYGRMLFANRHYGWARLLFQKNLSRWKHWQPTTPDTERRLKEAESAIAECDRRLEE